MFAADLTETSAALAESLGSQKQRPVFSFLSAPALVLQISNCSSACPLKMSLFGCWLFPGSQDCCCRFFCVWGSAGPWGISSTNASEVRINGVWGFFSFSCNISSEQTPLCVCHSPMGHSPLPFLIVTDLVTVRLENPFYTPSCTSQPLGSPTPNFKTVMRRGSPQWEPNSSLRKIISKHFSCCSEFHLAGECHQTLFFFG